MSLARPARRLETTTTVAQGIDPLALLTPAGAGDSARFYWRAADGSRQVAGLGAALAVATTGADRLPRAWRRILDDSARIEPADGRYPALWLGGFAFEPDVDPEGPWAGFGAAWFALPRVTVSVEAEDTAVSVLGDGPQDGSKGWLERLVRASGGAGRAGRRLPAVAPGGWEGHRAASRQAWAADTRRRVERALEAIAGGRAEKVVVATSRSVRFAGRVESVAVLRRLLEFGSDCNVFLVSPRPDLALVGASPERLVRVSGRRLETTALAGSAPRSHDRELDGQIGRELTASPKDLREHAVVVESICSSLAGAGYELDVPAGPVLRRLRSIQHLETPITARLPGRGQALLEADRLHPTPALGGHPRESALRLLASVEGAARGWYAGGVGWLSADGDGEIAVAIRSLLVSGNTVTAFAGAGIVAGSDVDAEIAEIELKLEAALGALGV